MTEFIQYIQHAYHVAVHVFQVFLMFVGGILAVCVWLNSPGPTPEEIEFAEHQWANSRSNPCGPFADEDNL
jgi:hypothetical protein